MIDMTIPIVMLVGTGFIVTWIGLAIGFSIRDQNKQKERLSKSSFKKYC